jgi:NAD(P)-dependent dehydrogenase (short-subunit alcohol dehydrogenase family)
VEKVRSELGQITALAYNASGYGRGGFLEFDPKTIQQSFEVGVMGAVYLGQRVIPDMLSAGHGFISLTGATAALQGRAGFAPVAIATADSIAETILFTLKQTPDAWTHEIDERPHLEPF